MTVRNFFSSEPCLKKYQYDGPLRPYIDPFADWLKDYGFNKLVARRHLTNIAHFNYYLSNQTTSQKPFTEQDIQSFINNHIPDCHCQGWGQIRDKKKMEKSIVRFQKYLIQLHGINTSKEFSEYGSIHREYLKWMKDSHYLSDVTIKTNSNNIKKFLTWYKKTSNNKPLEKIGADEIEQFLLEKLTLSKRSIRFSTQVTLRNFFTFCYVQGITKAALFSAVPSIKKYKLSELPKAIEDSESIKFLKSIDRATLGGKRLYAITRLLFEYGVRGGQIRCLKIEDIDWHQEVIHFPALKGDKGAQYPMSAEVGNALLDYIKNVRPETSCKEIFLTMQAPVIPLKATTLSVLMRNEMEKAGIVTPQYGTHCFRHGFVSRLLKQGTSIKNIADCIGHRYIQSTFVYSKIDLDALAEVALDLPEVIQ